MNKRTIFMAFTILAIILAACGPAATAEPTEPEAQEEPTTAPAEEPTEAPPTEVPEPVEIAFWYPYGEGSWTGDFLASKIEEFNAANPNITVVGQSYESYAAIIEGLQRSAAGGDLPGIATIGYGFDEYIVNSELATPIKAIMGDEGEEFLSDFFPSLLEVTTFDDGVYGVPLALSVAEVFYHSDLFEQAGLDPNDPPEAWADFLAAARTIHEELGIYGATFALDDPWIFETTVRSNGGQFLNDFETLQSFGAQQVAMFAVSSYGTLIYRDIAPLVKAMPWPAAEGEVVRIPAGGNSLYIFGNDDAEREAAAKFIVFLASPETNAEWAMNSGYLPTRESSLEAIRDFIDGFDNYEIAVDAIDNVVPPTQFGTNALQANQYIMEAIEAVMLGASEPAEALTEANGKINELLNE
jgi:ABC-type glycerol-3-phosphate transport system substrate-binding protein